MGTTAASARSGGNDDRITVTGSCSGSADWKVKGKTDDGRLEVEGEIDGATDRTQAALWAQRHDLGR